MKQRTDIPKLQSNERAFETNDGLIVVVKAWKANTHPKPDHLSFFVQARLVDEQGNTCQCGQHDVVCPAKSVTVYMDTVADGTTTVESLLAQSSVEEVDRLAKYYTGLRAWAVFPDDGQSR